MVSASCQRRLYVWNFCHALHGQAFLKDLGVAAPCARDSLQASSHAGNLQCAVQEAVNAFTSADGCRRLLDVVKNLPLRRLAEEYFYK